MALGFPGVAGERKTKRYKITLAEGGAAFLIHHPAGNSPPAITPPVLPRRALSCATVPRSLQAPAISLKFDSGSSARRKCLRTAAG